MLIHRSLLENGGTLKRSVSLFAGAAENGFMKSWKEAVLTKFNT